MKSPTCATTRASRGLARPRSRTRAARMSTPCKKLSAVTSTLTRPSVGNTRNVLISDLAGRSNIVMKARELGIHLADDAPELREILARVKALEHQGYEFEAAGGSLAVLIRKVLHRQTLPFEVIALSRLDAPQTADRPFARRPSRCRSMASSPTPWPEGDGPVNALDSALRAALADFYPQVEEHPPDRLQGPHPGLHRRHRRQNPRPDPIQRRARGMGNGWRQRQHHRGQLAGAGRFDGIPPDK